MASKIQTCQIRPEDFSNYGLARMIMKFLWRCYDSGGVSMGRSLRAGLLEACTNILPQPPEYEIWDEDILDAVDMWGLVEEADKRTQARKSNEVQLVLFQEVEFIPDWEFSCLTISRLVEWYANEALKSEWDFGSERKVVYALFSFMRGPHIIKQFSDIYDTLTPLHLIEDGRRRYRQNMCRTDHI